MTAYMQRGVNKLYVEFVDVRAMWTTNTDSSRQQLRLHCVRVWTHRDTHGLVLECPDVENYKRPLNLVWHRMLYSCTHMTTVGIKNVNSIQALDTKDLYVISCV